MLRQLERGCSHLSQLLTGRTSRLRLSLSTGNWARGGRNIQGQPNGRLLIDGPPIGSPANGGLPIGGPTTGRRYSAQELPEINEKANKTELKEKDWREEKE